tara:strand:+ start:211 stop:330 length:120 start_codon:yes stop_codon:yes gene_type:complete
MRNASGDVFELPGDFIGDQGIHTDHFEAMIGIKNYHQVP